MSEKTAPEGKKWDMPCSRSVFLAFQSIREQCLQPCVTISESQTHATDEQAEARVENSIAQGYLANWGQSVQKR